MNNNNPILDKIDTLASTKQEELFALQSRKEDLRESMSDPDTINENAFDIEEKQREMNMLNEVREYAVETGATDKSVFNDVLDNYTEVIKDREEQGSSAIEEKLNFNSLKIVSSEIESLDGGDDGDDKSEPMDISSSDDSGE